MKKFLRYQLLEKNKYIAESYEDYARIYSKKSIGNILRRLAKIGQLNYLYYTGRNLKSMEDLRFSAVLDDFAAELMEYDTISFDVYDTLIFRAFDRPVDVFLYMESKYGFVHFQEMRIKAEERSRCHKKNGEVTIHDIYETMSRQCSLDATEWVSRELDAEKGLCFANPYMLEVVQRLKKAGKQVIAVSDMYLTESMIRDILEQSGYEGITNIFVSCEHGESKYTGGLYAKICKKLKLGHVIHIGDNYNSDVQMAKAAGWNAYYYPNVNRIRHQHPYDMSALYGGLYRGLTNAYLNCGYYKYNHYFEYGFVNGGLLTYGYCQWLNDYAKEKGIEKILFIARDGYIMKKVYDQCFSGIDSDYVLFSRYNAQQILFEQYTDRYMEQMIKARAIKKTSDSITQVFSELDLEFLIPFLEDEELNKDTLLTMDVYEKVEDFIYKYKSTIVKEFEKTQKATFDYYRSHIGNVKKVMVVDLGWFGTCLTALNYLLCEKYKTSITLYGALVGGTGGGEVDARIMNHHLRTYVFSKSQNESILQWHMNRETVIHNILTEVMFTEQKPSFLKFCRNHTGILEEVYGYDEAENYPAIESMHAGIMAFVNEFQRISQAVDGFIGISGGDAYAPVKNTMKKPRLCYEIFKEYQITQLSGKFSKKTIQTVGEIMKDYNYI